MSSRSPLRPEPRSLAPPFRPAIYRSSSCGLPQGRPDQPELSPAFRPDSQLELAADLTHSLRAPTCAAPELRAINNVTNDQPNADCQSATCLTPTKLAFKPHEFTSTWRRFSIRCDDLTRMQTQTDVQKNRKVEFQMPARFSLGRWTLSAAFNFALPLPPSGKRNGILQSLAKLRLTPFPQQHFPPKIEKGKHHAAGLRCSISNVRPQPPQPRLTGRH
jgi:hypothetical protein